MVLEQALLHVLPGQQAAFEQALEAARPLIAQSPGFHGMEVRRDLETPGVYLLLAKWASIASHQQGFRHSDRYEEWRRLLHPYYDPMPVVRYFGEPV
ncbi:MAG: antibiotic biosynthesis monooxygenase family protein [Sphingomonas sp.]